jgi:hypothetical protein
MIGRDPKHHSLESLTEVRRLRMRFVIDEKLEEPQRKTETERDKTYQRLQKGGSHQDPATPFVGKDLRIMGNRKQQQTLSSRVRLCRSR